MFKTKKLQKSIGKVNITNKNSVIFRKTFVWIDIEFYDNEFFISQKLNNFFGQIGIFENIEILTDYIDSVFKSLDFSYLFFNQEFDFYEDDNLNLLEELNELEGFNEFLDIYESEFDNEDDKINTYNILEDKIEIVENKTEDEDEDDYDYFLFFVPLALVMYKNLEKKTDFFLANEFKYKLYFKKSIIFLKNKFMLSKIFNKKYTSKFFFNNFFNTLKKFNNLKSGLFKLLANSNIFFLKKKYYININHICSKKKIKKKKKKNLNF